VSRGIHPSTWTHSFLFETSNYFFASSLLPSRGVFSLLVCFLALINLISTLTLETCEPKKSLIFWWVTTPALHSQKSKEGKVEFNLQGDSRQ